MRWLRPTVALLVLATSVAKAGGPKRCRFPSDVERKWTSWLAPESSLEISGSNVKLRIGCARQLILGAVSGRSQRGRDYVPPPSHPRPRLDHTTIEFVIEKARCSGPETKDGRRRPAIVRLSSSTARHTGCDGEVTTKPYETTLEVPELWEPAPKDAKRWFGSQELPNADADPEPEKTEEEKRAEAEKRAAEEAQHEKELRGAFERGREEKVPVTKDDAKKKNACLEGDERACAEVRKKREEKNRLKDLEEPDDEAECSARRDEAMRQCRSRFNACWRRCSAQQNECWAKRCDPIKAEAKHNPLRAVAYELCLGKCSTKDCEASCPVCRPGPPCGPKRGKTKIR